MQTSEPEFELAGWLEPNPWTSVSSCAAGNKWDSGQVSAACICLFIQQICMKHLLCARCHLSTGSLMDVSVYVPAHIPVEKECVFYLCLQQVKYIPTSGPSHLQFPLPFPQDLCKYMSKIAPGD